MAERGAIFNADMVRALQRRAKTQTRRPVEVSATGANGGALLEIVPSESLASRGLLWDARYHLDNPRTLRSPLGAVGDLLYVRETYSPRLDVDPITEPEKARHYMRYRADGDDLENEWHSYGQWCPSSRMPKWAARLWLEITGVRVERVASITEEDARAEGVEPQPMVFSHDLSHPLPNPRPTSHIIGFRELWASIYGYESWARKDWVWVYNLRCVDRSAVAA